MSNSGFSWKQLGAFTGLLGVVISSLTVFSNTIMEHYLKTGEKNAIKRQRNLENVQKTATETAQSVASLAQSMESLANTVDQKANRTSVEAELARIQDKVVRNTRELDKAQELAVKNQNKIQRMMGRLDVTWKLEPDSIALARLVLSPEKTSRISFPESLDKRQFAQFGDYLIDHTQTPEKT